MCDFAVDVADIGGRFATPEASFAEPIHRLETLIADGLVEHDDHALRITPLGRPVARVVAAAFDAYLSDSTSALRHAKV